MPHTAIELLLAFITGGGLLKLIDQLIAWGKNTAKRKDRRTDELLRYKRRAISWEMVAKRTRIMAVSLGANLKDLPAGPGEIVGESGPIPDEFGNGDQNGSNNL